MRLIVRLGKIAGIRRERLIAVMGLVTSCSVFSVALASSATEGAKGASTFVNPVGMTMILVSPDSFQMGSPRTESGREGDEVQRAVALTRPFFAARTEVTQDQWRRVMETSPSQSVGGDRPVESISWFEAVRFCNRLSEIDGRRAAYFIDGKAVSWDPTADGYRLPTEAEWEFVARAGTRTRFWSGNDLDGLYRTEWARDSRPGHGLRSVATGAPNPWGFYDTLGNAWEWCWDWFDFYDAKDTLDPAGPPTGRHRVFRGGSGFSAGERCRAAARDRYAPGFRNAGLGFRPACGGL